MAIGGQPNNGLALLGDVLQRGSRDYRDIKLADEAHERSRSERAADLADQRAFARERFDIEREAAREDRGEAMQRAMLSALINKGYLSPNDVDDEQKIEQAFEEAKRDGLVQRYNDLISAGFLAPGDVADPAKVAAAEAEFGDEASSTRKSMKSSRGNAESEVTRLRDENMQIQQEIQQLQEELSKPPRAPTEQEVANHAQKLASQMTGKPATQLSREDIAAAMPQAEKELSEFYQMQAFQMQAAARQQLAALKSQLQFNTSQGNNLSDRFKVAPGPVPEAPAASAPMGLAPPRTVTPEERQAAFAQAIAQAMGNTNGGPAPAGVIPTQLQPLPGGDEIPEIAAENQRRASMMKVAPVAAPVQRTQEISGQIAARRGAVGPIPGVPAVNMDPMGIPMVGPDSSGLAREVQAADLSRLYQQLVLARQQEQAGAAQMGAPTPMRPMTPTPAMPFAQSASVFTTQPSPVLQRNSPFELAQ